MTRAYVCMKLSEYPPTPWGHGVTSMTMLCHCYMYQQVQNVGTVTKYIIEQRHEISNNVVYATSKVSDQPAHTRSLIRAFASRLNNL